jgi:hypothetical protein
MNVSKERGPDSTNRVPRPVHLPRAKYSPQNNSRNVITRIASVILELFVALLAALAFPFARININPRTLSPSCKKVTVLVHGFFHNRTAWVYMRQRFEKCPDLGPIFTINLGHPYHSIEEYTEVLRKEIVKIKMR